MTPVLWRELQWYALLVVTVLEWLAAALIVWGCIVAGVRIQENQGRTGGRLTPHEERRLQIEARRGIREVERYLAGQEDRC